jgi:aspartate kinase
MDRSIILAVGEGMKHKPGVMQRITGALAKEGINIESIDQGASEISVALGVKQEHSKQAVNAIHNEFFK